MNFNVYKSQLDNKESMYFLRSPLNDKWQSIAYITVRLPFIELPVVYICGPQNLLALVAMCTI